LQPFLECKSFKPPSSQRARAKSAAEVASILDKDGGVLYVVCFLFSGNHLAEHLQVGLYGAYSFVISHQQQQNSVGSCPGEGTAGAFGLKMVALSEFFCASWKLQQGAGGNKNHFFFRDVTVIT